jgi:two-component system NtrC family response regulator
MVEFEKFDPLLWEAIKNNRILLPPLRKVPTNLLIEEVKKFIENLTIKYRKKVILSDASVEKIKNYSWPGNLEELYQTIETAFILCREGVIQESDLLIGLWKDYEKKDLNLRKNIENLEKAYILQAYRLLGGNQVHMANVLGISRGSLQYKLQKYGIKLYDES